LPLRIDACIATEDFVADLKDSNQVPTEAPAKDETADAKKTAPTPKKGTGRKARTPRTRSKQPSISEAAPPTIAPGARKKYSEKERAEKLSEIERQTGRGTSVKDAVKKGYAWLGGLAELRDVTYVDLPTSHWPMWSRPRELAGIIGDVAKAHAPGA
jgi:hypothetical protein